MKRSPIAYYRHTGLFFILATVIPWSLWFIAAYFSQFPNKSDLLNLSITSMLILGLCAPGLIAYRMIAPYPELYQDLKQRLFNMHVAPRYWLITCFLMLISILLAQAISLLFGYSSDQFLLVTHASFHGGALPGWFWLFFAPLAEELGWHTYGTDCLRRRMSLFNASLLFSIYWAFWHYPSFLIKGYYQSNLEQLGFIYSLNFMVSIIPFVLIMNWLYYKTNRNVLVAILFHITAGFFNECFQTNPNSKLIQTALLVLLSVFLIMKERDFFFEKKLSN